MGKIILIFILFINLSYIYANSFNALVNEQSPYLLRHAKNPVFWYPWKENLFKKAKKENKLIFVSIGYSTCHWCHVMEKESFENNKIASFLNKDYISIKIDREELPHIDLYYQDIFSKLKKRRNGWPLNIILSPKKEIIYISTYIPNINKYEVEGMETLIPRLAKEYKNKDKRLLARIELYKKNIILKEKIENSKKLNDNIDIKYINLMKKRYDEIYKGFDKQPKFPLFKDLDFLYDLSLLKNENLNKEAYSMYDKSLETMARSGVFDQIEGGFYRYSVYPDWIIPHFEKMLYTQAEAISTYTKAYLKSDMILYKKLIDKTISFVNSTFKTNNNLYYSASDADSLSKDKKRVEGYYYTYSYDNLEKILKSEKIDNYEEILEYLGFDDFGNFDNGLNNVYFATGLRKEPKNLERTFDILMDLRKTRSKPFIDKKIITSWNALMIKSLYKASVLDNKYLLMAEKSLGSLLSELYVNGVLYHQKFDTLKAKQRALLEDYAFVIDMLVEAYQSTYKKIYLDLAKKLALQSIKKFYKNKNWYFDEEKKYRGNFIDRYYVSAISSLLHSFLSISNLSYDLDFLAKAKKYIKEQENRILLSYDKHPEGLRLLLRLNYGDIILKATKGKLEKNRKEIEKLNYPFLLRKKEHSKYYLLCDEISCFAYDEEFEKIIEIINK